MLKKTVLALAIFAVTLPAHASEYRCGWLQNPTPANWYLKDRDGSWTISSQGGYQAEGMENLPSFNSREYVKTNGYYGYGCACLQVETNVNQMRIVSIENGQSLKLNVCREDPTIR
ncbi:MAG: DUF4087 domain-containing protein [Pseudanabaena sp. ELA607]